MRRCRPPRGGADRNKKTGLTDGSPLVAPHAGARIETEGSAWRLTRSPVAPHAGARIETTGACPECPYFGSPPTRGRGSKQRQRTKGWRMPRRPPRGGADRNHATEAQLTEVEGRPPRGGADGNIDQAPQRATRKVAPHAGARIETVAPSRSFNALVMARKPGTPASRHCRTIGTAFAAMRSIARCPTLPLGILTCRLPLRHLLILP